MKRAAFFIDGYNLYHSLKCLRQPHLKWLNLRALANRLIPAKTENVEAVYYFSALAEWLSAQKAGHEAYIAALHACGTIPIMGKFKEKDKHCPLCSGIYIGHEEKETDVNIALHILNEAHKDSYDCAYIISRDSDLKPALTLVKELFPQKELIIVAPPHAGHSFDLLSCADRKNKINKQQLAACLLPETIRDAAGAVVARRPLSYAPTPNFMPLRGDSIQL